MKRSSNDEDPHSGQICFPGGKLDQGESDIEGGVREFHEELGPRLTEINSYHLGQIPKNHFVYYNKFKGPVFISNNIYILNEEMGGEWDHNQDEVEDYWWTDLDYFFEGFDQIFENKKIAIGKKYWNMSINLRWDGTST